MSETSRVEHVIRSAWERRLLVIAVERTAIAAAAVLGAFVLMLLVGTQVLDWRWLLLLGAAGLGIAGYQVRQRLLGHYRVAQILDGRLHLEDSLSTAWYLRNRLAQSSDPIAEYQLKGAERAAERVNVADAFPFIGGRPWMIAGVLALAAASLFSIRYFVTNSLSLQHSLIPLQLSEVFERHDKESEETKRQRADAKGSDEPRSQKSTPKADGQKDAKDPQRAEQPPVPQGSMPGAGQSPNQPADLKEGKQGPEDQSKQSSEGAAGSAQSKAGEKQGEDGEKQAGSQKPSASDDANNPKSSNGLIDKVKDALSSLAAKMRPNSQQKGKEPQSGEKKSGEEKSGDSQQGSPEQNNAAQQSSNQESSDQQQAAEGQKGQTQEQSKAGQGKSANQSGEKSKSDSHSGIGSQDGDKSTKDADQLKALGKLAEIIGKRSASASGDVMVENPSGKQRLRTEYSQRQGQHADLGGEINRDEIPLMYQQYVREYMSQVRKQAKQHRKPSQANANPQ